MSETTQFLPRAGSVHDLLFAPGSRGILIATSRDPDAKRTFIVTPPAGNYVDGPAGPAAIKIPVTVAAAGAINREIRMLLALLEADLGDLERTVPRYLHTLDSDGLPAVVTTVLRGTPMSVTYHRWMHTARRRAVATDFALAGDWLQRFQSATAGEPSRITWAAEVAAAVRDRWAGNPRLEAAQVRLAAADRQLRRQRVARTMVHGDYWFGNLLVDEGRISGVVDWESGVRRGWPLRDLVRFALTYCLYLDRHTREGRAVRGHRGLRRRGFGGGIRYGLLEAGWLPDLVRLSLRTGIDSLGLPAGLWYGAALAGLGEIAAGANDDEFAEHHLALLAELPYRPLADELRRS
ncbi:phosphotransferase family enzyme [Kribbella pratensis]|uniref:Phosphotransferase family enzyme n=1 Tax=Kribbella pratensis TaxID=2512112 RepID=A0ABY2FSA8_9ACTN|nr:aminoglycoside phosphotransferase family protein [Kribbella pratensis]TDW95440.1 phosphotransferase family enzyme [Kribbella pratensis]